MTLFCINYEKFWGKINLSSWESISYSFFFNNITCIFSEYLVCNHFNSLSVFSLLFTLVYQRDKLYSLLLSPSE